MRRQILLAMVVALMASPAILAQSSRLVFVTDRTTTGDLDTWKSREDGSQPIEVTDEAGDARHPSLSRDGSKIVFELGIDLHVTGHDGSGTANLTGSGTNPCNQYSTDECGDPDAGPEIGGGDFWVVFTRRYPTQDHSGNPIVTELWMATYDHSSGGLDGSSFKRLTAIHPADGTQLDPAWCANDRVVWSRPSGDASFYEREICIMEVDADGPVGDPVCYFGDDGATDFDDVQPSCNADGSNCSSSSVRGRRWDTC